MMKPLFLASALCLVPGWSLAHGAHSQNGAPMNARQNTYERLLKTIEDPKATSEDKSQALQECFLLSPRQELNAVRKAFLQSDEELSSESAMALIRDFDASRLSNLRLVQSNITNRSSAVQIEILSDFADRVEVQPKEVQLLFHDIAKKVLIATPREETTPKPVDSVYDAASYACLVISLSPSYHPTSDAPLLLRAVKATKAPGRVALALCYRKLLTSSIYQELSKKKIDILSQQQSLLIAGADVDPAQRSQALSLLQKIISKPYPQSPTVADVQLYIDKVYLYMLRFVHFGAKEDIISQASTSPSPEIRKASLLLSVEEDAPGALKSKTLSLFNDKIFPIQEKEALLAYIAIKSPDLRIRVNNHWCGLA